MLLSMKNLLILKMISRGVKNVIGLKRPVPYEIDLQGSTWFIDIVKKFNSSELNLISSLTERQDVLNQLVITLHLYL